MTVSVCADKMLRITIVVWKEKFNTRFTRCLTHVYCLQTLSVCADEMLRINIVVWKEKFKEILVSHVA